MTINKKEAATIAVSTAMHAPTLKTQSVISKFLTPEQAKHLVDVLENKLKAVYTPPKPNDEIDNTPKLK